MRGSSVIAICEVAGMGREITVRNVFFGGIAARPEDSPHPARQDASPHRSYLTSRLPNGHPF